MPRFAPLRSLRRLAADHAGAERAGMPVDEFRERRPLPRRDLLRYGALAGGVALAGGLLRTSSASAATAPRIAVVGAGISGLNAALALHDAGVACTVYEAGDRLGGRMFSERTYWDQGQTTEWGGELIDSDHRTVLALCERFGLPVVDVIKAGPRGGEEVFHFLGDYYPRAQADEDFRPVWRALRADLEAAGDTTDWQTSTPAGVELSRMSVREWIETRVPDGLGSRLGQFIDDAYTVEYGADTTEQTALGLVYLMGYQQDPRHFHVWGLSDERFHIVGGNQQLPEAIAAALPPGTVRHGCSLVALRANADGTQTLTFDTGGARRDVTADHTILAVPLGVLQRIDLSRAGFDRRKRESLDAMRMGCCTKLNMQLSSRVYLGEGPWPGVSNGECFADTGFQQVWDATRGQGGRAGVLIQYGGGRPAASLRPPAPFLDSSDHYVRDTTERVLDSVDKVLPGVRDAWIGKSTLSAWHLNPLSHGAYSYWPTDYCHRYAGYEAVRQGNVHFAGEHTSVAFQGFMNGGAEAGERAAQEVLGDLR
ncbi:flavin monoamine oxidase family protein [Saccharopolyspora rosea]|uniref:Flavin monoamine oxidase family protein n=1 Tax=Saccharopolyspora rosea TaxID=524884 RepID=A0ABW3FQ26_9PSEU|nr:FAD-dependent oxidoreductase [Saccharopolyspora rosea]